MRRVVEQFRLGLGFFRDLDQGIGETIQRVLVFGFGRFDHQRFVDDEREVVRRRVEFVIHQAFGDVQRADITACELTFHHEFVHADAVIRDGVCAAQFCLQIVGVEHGILRNGFQAIGSVHGDVGVSADKSAAEVTVEGFHASDGLLGCDEAIERSDVVIAFFDDADQRRWEEIQPAVR